MDLYQFLSHYDSLINVDHVLTITKTRTEEQLLQLHWTTQFKHMIMRMNHKKCKQHGYIQSKCIFRKNGKEYTKNCEFHNPLVLTLRRVPTTCTTKLLDCSNYFSLQLFCSTNDSHLLIYTTYYNVCTSQLT